MNGLLLRSSVVPSTFTVLRNSSISWWDCNIPFPWATYLKITKTITLETNHKTHARIILHFRIMLHFKSQGERGLRRDLEKRERSSLRWAEMASWTHSRIVSNLPVGMIYSQRQKHKHLQGKPRKPKRRGLCWGNHSSICIRDRRKTPFLGSL